MITHITYKDLGSAHHGWLDTRYHFSFSDYHNPKRMGFGLLRVINDDIVKPNSGFSMHPHRDMEIITYVRQGAITHEDNMGNRHRLKAGEVQIMSAGTGVMHSEYNLENTDAVFYQIWIKPNQKSVKPVWETHPFTQEFTQDALPLLISGDGTAPLTIHQDAFIYGGLLQKDTQLHHPIKHQAYILISDGSVQIGGITAHKGDAIEITEQQECHINAIDDAEIIVIDVP